MLTPINLLRSCNSQDKDSSFANHYGKGNECSGIKSENFTKKYN